MKKIITYGMIAILCLSFVMADKQTPIKIEFKGESNIPYADTDILFCRAAWGETCPDYTANKNIVLKYYEENYLDELMKGQINIKTETGKINVVFKAGAWGNDYDTLVSGCGDVTVKQKIGKKTTVFKDTNKLCNGKKSTSESYANFYSRGGDFCVNFGIMDKESHSFCVE